ncbi:MAG: hypothetical protein D6814_03585 [Calditrichaeota bacterium]|nr:MAG: hypothetical protein D6814_03585 [Calditrichota bacterium]
MKYFVLGSFLLLIGAFSCSTADQSGAGVGRSSRDVITLSEIKNTSAANAFDLIRQLRPHWLRGRGQKSILIKEASFPVVYVNGSQYGDINSLETISSDNITEIEFLRPSEVGTHFGMNHPGGAILITIF